MSICKFSRYSVPNIYSTGATLRIQSQIDWKWQNKGKLFSYLLLPDTASAQKRHK